MSCHNGERATPVASTQTQSNTHKHKDKPIAKILQENYDIWQALSIDESQAQKQMVKHDQRSMVKHDQRSIIIVCKDERDWIDPETKRALADFIMCDIKMITKENMPEFKYSVIFLDDMGDKLNKK